MPPKSKDKKKKKTEYSPSGEAANAVCLRFLKSYEKECTNANCLVSPDVRSALKTAIEDEKFLTKIVIESQPINNPDEPRISLEALLSAMRTERYNYIKAIYIWSLPLTNTEITALALLLEKAIYDIKALDLMDNMIEVYGVRRLSQALHSANTLTTLSLDYNEFGDDGCKHLCDGLVGNETLLNLSLNFCCLTAQSAGPLSRVVSTTSIQEIFLDGNDFGCLGAMKLISPLVDQAEADFKLKKKLEAAEQEAKLLQAATPQPAASEPSNKEKKKKKGKKKGKKGMKKNEKASIVPGPWISKLHLADNGIDSMAMNYNDLISMQCMKMFHRLIASSECLKELDLEDNLIGDMGGSELIDALLERKEDNKLPGIRLRTSHRMQSETFKQLVKLGAGDIKKKKGKRTKKK